MTEKQLKALKEEFFPQMERFMALLKTATNAKDFDSSLYMLKVSVAHLEQAFFDATHI